MRKTHLFEAEDGDELSEYRVGTQIVQGIPVVLVSL